MCVARLWGSRRDRAIAEWGRCDGQKLAQALGFTHAKTPCAAPWSRVLRQLAGDLVAATLGAWAASVLTALPPAPGERDARAVEGQTRRGSRQQGAPAVHLLAVLRHRLGLPLWHQAVADKTNAIPVREAVWRGLLGEGRVSTGAAVLTQRALADRIVHGGGDDVMLGTGNPPQLQHDMPVVCHEAHALVEPLTAPESVASGHGRLEQRRLTASAALVGDSDGPGLAPVFQWERGMLMTKSGPQRHEVVSGVTSRSRDQAAPARLLGWVRQHGQIENKRHGVREVTFAEDRSHVRCGCLPQLRAAFRNTAIGLRHGAGETNIAAACRRVAAQPWSALALIGINPDN